MKDMGTIGGLSNFKQGRGKDDPDSNYMYTINMDGYKSHLIKC